MGNAATKPGKDIYGDFDNFLKLAISDFYQRGGKQRKGDFLALLIASGEISSMALDSLKGGVGVKKLALGAVTVIALRAAMRWALGGPLGLILVGISAVSLIGYFVAHRAEIAGKIGRNRELVAHVRQSYEGLQQDFRDARLNREQRDLMIDGLRQRLMLELDAG